MAWLKREDQVVVCPSSKHRPAIEIISELTVPSRKCALAHVERFIICRRRSVTKDALVEISDISFKEACCSSNIIAIAATCSINRSHVEPSSLEGKAG